MSSNPSRKSLGDLLKQAREDAPAQPRGPADLAVPALVVRSIALTPTAQDTLTRLIDVASAATGRKASASAVVRALLRWAEQQNADEQLVQIMKAELTTGEVVWGKRGKRRR
jgi:hypothetical protein